MGDFDSAVKNHLQISYKEKALAILIIVFLFSILVLPVLQAAHNRELSVKLNRTEKEIAALEEQQRVLKAKLAQSSMPEQTLLAAQWQGLILKKLLLDDMKIVHVEDTR
jgi:cell division protein FtsL